MTLERFLVTICYAEPLLCATIRHRGGSCDFQSHAILETGYHVRFGDRRTV